MELCIYKPTKNQTGGAFKFNLHKERKFSFMKAAPQIAPMGEAKVFGWDEDKSINVKMTADDLASILSVIIGMNEDIKLYHQTDLGNKVIEFKHEPTRKGFSLKVSQKDNDAKEARSVFAGVNYAEAAKLRVFIEHVIAENLWAKSDEYDASKQNQDVA